MTTFSRLDLRGVTACAVDCLNPAVAAYALSRSAALCDFADVILLTDAGIFVGPEMRVEKIDRIGSREEYSRFVLTELHQYVKTSHMLIVQWDGFVVDASAWRQEFLDYDYIGPRWPWADSSNDVGNGGFSLRSTRLMRLMSQPEFAAANDINEDIAICQAFRPKLQTKYGIRFAPAHIADQFAKEYELTQTPIFGFHGAFHMWMHISDETMIEIIRTLDPRTFSSSELFLLLYDYYLENKTDCMRALYSRFMETQGRERILNKLAEAHLPLDLMTACLDACERIA